MAVTKVLLISPNLAPENCGVSDYCFVIADYLQKLGYTVYMIALSDHFTNDIIATANSLRIPSSTSFYSKNRLARKFIKQSNPNYIFFNFVSYGYHSKGLPFYLVSLFSQIQIPVFFIFHELWIGNFDTEGFKKKILGKFQRKLILWLIKKIVSNKRIVVSDVFKFFLSKNHIKSSSIPVFSNIPLCGETDNIHPNEIYQFVFFGSLAFKTDVQAFVIKIKEVKKSVKKPIRIVHIGIWQGYTEHLLNAIDQLSEEGISFHRTGQLSKNEISDHLNNADLGLTTYIPAFWSKSGSVAAMFMHGLPVLSIAEADELNNLFANIELPRKLFTLTTPTPTIVQAINANKQPNKDYNNHLLANLIHSTIG